MVFKNKAMNALMYLTMLLLLSLPYSSSLSCDKVSTLPSSFDILMPDHEKLFTIHISNNFFLESSINKEQSLTINLKEKSVIKIQVTSYHSYLNFKIKTPSTEQMFRTSPTQPIDFTLLDPNRLFEGEVVLTFSDFVQEQDTLNQELTQSAIQDTICNLPYMYLDIYYEKYQHYQARVDNVAKSLTQLKDFNEEYWSVFEELKSVESKSKNKNVLVSKVKRDFSPFKLSMKNTIAFYKKYNINVVNDYKITVPNDHLTAYDEKNDLYHIVTKYFIKMQIYSDFLLGGGLHLLIVHSNGLDQLQNLKCLTSGKCILSERRSKNAIILETILSPGSYTLLLINLNAEANSHLFDIPITAGIKLKYIKKTENRFNCQGKRLPTSLDDYLKVNPNYFEYKGKIVFNMRTLKDIVYINIPKEKDYFMRINSYFVDGNNIDIRLIELRSGSGLSSGNTLGQVSLSNNLNSKDEVLYAQSSNWGGQSSLYVKLKQGISYAIVFDYSHSFFTQYVRKTCELYYLKMALSSESNSKLNSPMSLMEQEKCPTAFDQLDSFIQNFEDQHTIDEYYKYQEYKQISNEIYAYNTIGQAKNFKIIYTKSFNVKTPISFYIEVMSDFVTSSVIPVLIPVPIHTPNLNPESYLQDQYQKLILHKGTINMKMTPGKYQLVFLHGLNQVTPDNDKYGDFTDLVSMPLCSVFKLKINIIRLTNNKLLNWECHFQKFHHIPETVELSESKSKYFYFNHHVLVPIERDMITIKTTNSKFLLRLRAQFTEGESTDSMSISLKRSDKSLSQAKKEVFEEGKESNIVYLNYLLSNNAVYEIHFANKFNSLSEFYDKCRLFTLDLMLAKSSLQNEQCEKNIPSIDKILFQKIIDEDNSYSQYNQDSLYQTLITRINDKSTLNNDLESTRNMTMFSFKFDANDTMSFEYPFEIHTGVAKATMIIETPYALPIEVSARMYVVTTSDKKNTQNLIATEDIEDENIYTMRGILLTFGKYVVKFGVNQQMYNNVVAESLKDYCVQFTATIIIENKSFDTATKGATQKSENCPYIEFPKSLNLPGWIYSDTSNILNSRFRFKIKSRMMTKEFTLTQKSLFKFHLFDDDRVKIHNDISLSQDRGNKIKLIMQKMTREDNYISITLDKGKYIIDFQFELNNNKGFFLTSDKDNYEHLCYFFDVYITVQPLDEIKYNDYEQCTTDLSKLNEPIKQSAVETYSLITYKDTEYKTDTNLIKTIKIDSNNVSGGKIILELITNSYLSPVFGFHGYSIDPLSTNVRTIIPSEVIYADNFLWLTLNIQKNIKYEIDIRSGSYLSYSQCLKGYVSVAYELTLDDQALSRKTKCEVNEKLPIKLYQSQGTILTSYGGGQAISNGEMYFYGKFLIPKSSFSQRTEIVIKEPSIVIIQLNPLYNSNKNNIFMELFKETNIVSRYSHTELNGLIVSALSNESYSQKVDSLVHYLDITFDRMLSKCESYELLFSIVPKSAITSIYLNCNAGEEVYKEIPNQFTVSSTQTYQFSSHIKLGFTQNDNSNYEKIIIVDIINPTVFEAKLKYIHSENMMHISINNEERRYYAVGKETIERGHTNGIWIHKTISAILKPGKYKIKLLSHSIYTSFFRKMFTNEYESFCYKFKFDISASILNLNANKPSTEDESNTEAEIKKLTSSDISKNVITKVSPTGAVNLRLGSKLEIKVSFALPEFTGNVDVTKYIDMISLVESSSSTSYIQGITPDYISSVKKDELGFVFEMTVQKFDLHKCFKLVYNPKFLATFDDIIIDKIEHLYCLMKCDCNRISNYSCSLNGKCQCKSPYTGLKCNECIEGYVLTNSGACISQNLSNMKCDDKTTCNDNGYCYFPGTAFNPFDLNVKSLCKCNDGFDTKSGYPISSFCNTCKNRERFYPFCHEKNSGDKLRFSWSTHCSDFGQAPVIPNQLYMRIMEQIDQYSVQQPDGSINFSGIYKTSGEDDYTEIMIYEESLIRVLYVSQEYNRAQLLLLNNRNSEDILVSTEGTERSESFIAKLTPRSSPYVIKIVHSRLKSSCNRYQIKISIKSIRLALYELTCSREVNQVTMLNYLPITSITLNGNDQNAVDNKLYEILDSLILSKQNYENNQRSDSKTNYAKKGVLTEKTIDEVFEYNIELNVVNSLTFSAIAHFKFITSDIMLSLRHSNGTLINNGNWLVPDIAQDADDFYSGVENILDPGLYYLTITQNIAANQIVHKLYSTETKSRQVHVDRCFKFMLNIQTNLINKPDKELPTAKFESMYNRIISVEPSSLLNAKHNQKLNIYVNFKESINSKTKLIPDLPPNQLGFNGVFFLTNQVTNVRVYPSHVYLQGADTKSFLLIYENNSLEKNSCYLLQYDLARLESKKDKTQKISADTTTHRFCTKDCECNENADYDCNGSVCLCKEPYTGNQCNECIDNYYLINKKCLPQSLCNDMACSGRGKCINNGQSVPSCICQTYFQGNDCSTCQDNDVKFPDCAAKYIKTNYQDNDEKGTVIDVGIDRIHQGENECKFSFLPYDLDNLGFLHLDGNMHISGIYSIKNIEGKKYKTAFTLKEASHIKLYLEHSKMTYSVTMFLVNQDNKLLLTSISTVGPAGVNTASILDFIGSQGKYFIVFYVKDLGSAGGEANIHYSNIINNDEVFDECLTVFMEMQTMTLDRENNVIKSFKEDNPSCSSDKDTIPQLIPSDMTMYNYLSKFQLKLNEGITVNYVHIRNKVSDSNTIYFYHEYIYIPDYVDREIQLELSVNSKFLNAEVGILLEVVDIPQSIKNTIKTLTSKKLEEQLSSKITEPQCIIHCYSGVKKYNSVVISRILPSDTLFRIWFYDISPKPYILPLSTQDYIANTCISYETSLQIINTETPKDKLSKQISASLCLSNELPTDLNNKDYLGDSKYIKRFGFHILDTFRIDKVTRNGSIHTTTFSLDKFHLFRLIVFPGRVDTDLELFFSKNESDILIAKSTSKNFEDAIVVELPPGKFKIVFKFYSPSSGYNKCESMKMEFAISSFSMINNSIRHMQSRYPQDDITHSKINIFEHFKNSNEIFNKDSNSNIYTYPLEKSFFINVDDIQKYNASITISEITFIIENNDNQKIELNAFTSSNFLFADVALYLTYTPTKGQKKVISSIHRKNMNTLITTKLKSGTYVLAVKYYRKLHYVPMNDPNFRDEYLESHSFSEMQFDAQLINLSNDKVSILTSNGYLLVQPQNSKNMSHNQKCRQFGLPVPKSFSSLRYLKFSSEMHIMDNFILPPMAQGENVIDFQLEQIPSGMIRIYVESHDTDIDIELREEKETGKYFVIAQSTDTIHFETIMQLIREKNKYQIVLKYKGYADATLLSKMICKTFKMEIAIEKNHNYACPISSKYAMLNDLKPIPEILPIKSPLGGSFYTYYSKSIFKGEDNGSGYVYMLRGEKDTTIDFASFTASQPIDLRFEVVNDFLQAPVTLMLTSNSQVVLEDNQSITKFAREGIDKLSPKGFIIAFGELFESRTTLLVKNLPKGKYSIYIHLPGLRTKFSEQRVCSIYDISIEAKKSRNHFRAKEIINTSSIKEDNLDLPIRLPTTLNSPRFMSGYGPYTYVNYLNTYFVRMNTTATPKEDGYPSLINTITFSLKTESLVEFVVKQDLLAKEFKVAIESITNFSHTVLSILKPGNYKAIIKLIDKKQLDPNSIVDSTKNISFNSLFTLFSLFIGISPINRVKDIYNYNTLLSSFRQCSTVKFPDKLDYNKQKGEFRYINEFMTYKRDNIQPNGILSSFVLELTNSSRNRFIAELGTDYVLNMLTIKVSHNNKHYEMRFENNRGMLDLILPRGRYTVTLVLINPVILSDYSCLLFSVNIRAIEVDNLPLGQSVSDRFSINEKDKSEILKPKCKGGVLPLEIYPGSSIKTQRISPDGTYILHIPNTVYFTNKQKSLYQRNINEIDINVNVDSLLRITTYTENPHVFNLVPKIKFQNQVNATLNDYYKNQRGGMVSKSLREKNSYWYLPKNTNTSKDFYVLELGLENDDSSAVQSIQSCPKYNFDILIYSINKLSQRFNCIVKNGTIYQTKKPTPSIPAISNIPYHENITSAFFTEKEYRKYKVSTDFYSGLAYYINLTLLPGDNRDYYVEAKLGYPHSSSLFDIFLFKDISLISYSTLLFSKNSTFTYQRLLQATLKEGNYSLVITEYLWHNMTQLIKAKSDNPNKDKLYLCLPFSYSMDITPFSEKNIFPKITSIYPPGPVIIKVKDADLGLTVRLTTAPFTKNKEPITMVFNHEIIINAFYIAKRAKDSSNTIKKIHPVSAQSNVNSKEWMLFFSNKQFEGGVEYDFALDSSWLYDSQGTSFSTFFSQVIIKSESSSESTAETSNGNLNTLKSALDDHLLIGEAAPEITVTKETNQQCNNHGIYIYDYIFQKYICTCFDGFAGKYCDFCEGKIIDNKCVYEDDSIEIQTHDVPSARIEDFAIFNKKDTGKQDETKGIDCGNCFNGICDYSNGKCICDQGYIGLHCDTKKLTNQVSSQTFTQQSTSYDIWSKLKSVSLMIIKLLIAFAVVIGLFYLYESCKTQRTSSYNILSQNDKNLTGTITISDNNAINPIVIPTPNQKKNEEDPDSDTTNLVDYEISTTQKKK